MFVNRFPLITWCVDGNSRLLQLVVWQKHHVLRVLCASPIQFRSSPTPSCVWRAANCNWEWNVMSKSVGFLCSFGLHTHKKTFSIFVSLTLFRLNLPEQKPNLFKLLLLSNTKSGSSIFFDKTQERIIHLYYYRFFLTQKRFLLQLFSSVLNFFSRFNHRLNAELI